MVSKTAGLARVCKSLQKLGLRQHSTPLGANHKGSKQKMSRNQTFPTTFQLLSFTFFLPLKPCCVADAKDLVMKVSSKTHLAATWNILMTCVHRSIYLHKNIFNNKTLVPKKKSKQRPFQLVVNSNWRQVSPQLVLSCLLNSAPERDQRGANSYHPDLLVWRLLHYNSSFQFNRVWLKIDQV